MEIKAIDVKKLREETNAGMMDCKKALLESDGDFEKAKLLLREKGQSKADKKSGRTTAQGLVRIKLMMITSASWKLIAKQILPLKILFLMIL